ncbi:hypothetical protein TREVI0001_2533 [Treponema vincentii ATCC 35580]|uniref:Uncharacterized protein n=1 Tax=Treponema vincentii ATCC 35580 TaxID=596324 RepID=C8PQA1_9SPIR|nr:hypothetical protein [Treponema vincentii]EEV20417.1 hypothetical protein TREVI0001_2533 [Treponema vincentii ATCC 35580]
MDGKRDTQYKIEHWQQNIDDAGYTIVNDDTQSLKGKTNAAITVEHKNYDGFTMKSRNPLRRQSVGTARRW